jgi:hypothetical protein
LVAPGEAGGWTLAAWDGRAWFGVNSGAILRPQLFAVLPAIGEVLPPMIVIRPIAEAAVREGHDFGPCILDVDSEWITGYWNGEGWYSLEGDPVQPSRFGLLPPA